MNGNIKPHIYKAESFFTEDFPFAIRYAVNQNSEFNIGRRFQRKFWKIAYILSGEGNYIIGNLKFPFQKKTLIVVHPDAHTTYEIRGKEITLFNLVFAHSFLDQNFTGIQDNLDFLRIFSTEYDSRLESPLFLLSADKEIDTLIHRIYNEFESNEHNRQWMLKLYFLELLLLIVRRSEHMSVRNPEWTANYVHEYLQQNFQKEFSQKDLAVKLGLTPERLCRLYREHSGNSIMNELKRIRLDHAAELLTASSLKIWEISEKAGFRDLRNFYRTFKNFFGMTPEEFRINHTGKN